MELSTELTLLGWSVVLLIVHIVAQAASGSGELPLPYLLGPRDEQREPKSIYAGRASRALWNFLETYPGFIALALALAVAGKADGFTATGAHLWFWGRVAYLPLYIAGVPMARTIAWTISIIGLVQMLIGLLW